MKFKNQGWFKTMMMSLSLFIIMAFSLLVLMYFTADSNTVISIKDGLNLTDRLVVFRIFLYFMIVFSWPLFANWITKNKEDEVIRKSDYELIKGKQWHVAIILLLIELVIIQQLGF